MNINDGKKINKDGTFLGGCSACHSIDSGFPVRNPRSSNKGVWKARPTQSGPCGITWRVVTAVEPQRVVLKNYRGILHTDLEFSSSVFWIDLGFRILLPCDLLQLKCPQDTPWGTGRMETWAVWLYWQCAMLISKFPVLRSEAMHNSTLLQRNALKVGAWVNEMERRVELVRCGAWAQAQDLWDQPLSPNFRSCTHLYTWTTSIMELVINS